MLTDVHVALIGHTGKDESRGARGSNAHMADVDMMVQISVADDVRTATITKINDGAEGVLTRFKLKSSRWARTRTATTSRQPSCPMTGSIPRRR